MNSARAKDAGMVKKILKVVVLVVATAFVVIQFFQIDKTNPPIVETETLEATVSVPPDVSFILSRSCNDCHSQKTLYPWYISIQPAGWFMRDHIDHARSHLNFSVFKTYASKKQAKKLEEVCDEVEQGRMPLPSYLWLHREAVLSESDKRVLCDWAKQEGGKIVL
jgi:hypothetical protein